MKKIDTQIIRTGSNLSKEYDHLKKLSLKVMEISGQLWNWPLGVSLTTPTISRLLHLDNLYKKILDVPGVICEFGVHYGTSANVLINLKQIYEPRNVSRRFCLFDTFEGFIETNVLDGNKISKGDFKLVKGYKEILQNILDTQQKINQNESLNEFTIYEGDAISAVDNFLIESPEAMIAMVILDMDLYKPTKQVLESIIPRLSKGSIVVLDEFNHPDYPGETVALRELLDLKKIRLNKSEFLPYAAWFVW